MPTPLGNTESRISFLTGNPDVNSLISGTQWLPFGSSPTVDLTYSFIAPRTSYFANAYSSVNEYNAVFSLYTGQKTAISNALSTWSAVANVTFTMVRESAASVGDLRFGGYSGMDNKTAAWAYLPDNTPKGGDVWIGPSTDELFPSKGSYDYLTFVHEIGHAIGLKHPFSAGTLNPTVLQPLLDDVKYTVMSYNDNYSYQPTTPMVLDILAIQSLYGANGLWQSGNTTYSWAPNQQIFETIWDAGGNDTIDASNQLASVRINLNEGQYSQIGKAFTNLTTNAAFNEGLGIAYGAKIENAVGSDFGDWLIGNALDNVLNGRGGADTMEGGAGNDTYYVDNVGDVVIERGSSLSEIDTVISTISYTLGANVENLILQGGAENLNATGNALNNTLRGNAGNNLLDGGTGADIMIGGLGNDTYVVDSLLDTVIETSNLPTEIDTVLSAVNFALGANLENLTLLGTADINGNGNAQNNVLIGNAGNNVLNGMGGLDTMIGGAGHDLYILDQAGELGLIQEQANEGTDTLYISYVAGAGTTVIDLNRNNLLNVENVTLDNINTGPFTVLGNTSSNVLIGNIGNNVLDGGIGADYMAGGAGNDTYYVDNIGDTVVETGNSLTEIDTVLSTVSYALGNNVEVLALLGANNLNGTGNALNNYMVGNIGDNILNGGAGADTLIGGFGNDTYIVDNALDVVVETSNDPNEIDTVRASVNWQLGTNLENLTLTGNTNLNGNGNELNNVLVGNAANNVLNGMGGLDTMIGGAGNDTYVLDQFGELALVQEQASEGTDTLYIAYTAGFGTTVIDLNGSNLQNVENVTLDPANTSPFSILGNAQNNTLFGNAGNNVLNGGAGIDNLIGGTGNDTYIVDNQYDVVLETSTDPNEIDTIQSSVSWQLGANVENLTLTGNNNLNGNGNGLNNVLIGNAGNNVLNGMAGLDTMIGGTGNDTYVLDQFGELALVKEQANEGTDTLYVAYTAGFGTTVIDLNNSNLLNFENVTLDPGNTSPFTVTGNALNNTLIGNAGNNVLNGGAGADLLTGGAGADTFVFSAVNEMGTGANRDVITDFSSLQGDKIDLSKFDANLLSAGFNGFSFIGANDFTGAGQLRFVDHVLSGNVSGNAGADFEIQLVGVNSFSANDLVA
ncbi:MULTISPECIES: M10 family metallopeptidase C-terminal domain-containing protein [Pseudomonas]|uniref:Putative metallopeptidase with Hemolysin-type calcium-binding region n=1 Tax=Pseudomonas fluorescens (strain Pf0-1) TaxID=205922 RepID=Q3K712_PSEPF|nr:MULTISPECIES: M10 family metallopeptidase C-terminal domain-containing protein [Pseudomonas]ABA76442.1 putative metallopeptidase with Hemolysin-type calcium-binding region [Pseudomonas fluorescens Pf0-1]MBL0794295.1 matrixin family metalloprotease [Pseudomonas sp. B7]MBY9024370.1 matrixin family metalloprotease [Pseudomonas fluorescens]MBY9032980.1 matrixin family metalloprotease [Pseudomonas fluorescens]MBY9035713.1 matrixin family metalloprotease [Pseudomonas fluorescens]